MPRRDLVLPLQRDIWRNDTGVVLSNAGNLFLEVGGGARCSWVPRTNWVGNEGTLITRETPLTAVNNAVDTFRGWPQWRREHVFEVSLKSPDGDYPYKKLFFEWRGEHVIDSTGFALAGGAPADFTRVWWFSTGFAWACGSFFSETDLPYATEPFLMSWNTANTGKWYGPPSSISIDFQVLTQPLEIISGMPLICRSFTPAQAPYPAAGEIRNVTHPYSFARHPTAAETGTMTKGGLIWGSSANGTGGAPFFPRAGDKLGWVYEVGYPKGMLGHLPGSSVASSHSGAELSIAGLQKVYVTFREGAPATGGAPAWLDFTNASMTVRGRIKAILVP